MATKEEKLALLEKLNSRIAQLETQVPSAPKPGAMDTLKGAIKDAALNVVPGLRAADALSTAPAGVQRAVTTGVGAEIGRMAGPAGAALGAVTGSVVADAAQNPETAMSALSNVAKAAVPGKAPEVAEDIVQAVRGMDPEKAKEYVLEKAVLAGTSAALAGGVSKTVKAVKGKGNPAAIAFKDPAIAFDSVRNRVFKQHSALKKAFMRGDEAEHIAQTMKKVASPDKSVNFIANAYRQIKEEGAKTLTNTELIFLREAARKASKSKGGNIAAVAGQVYRVVDRKLRTTNRALWSSFKRVERAVKVAGDEKPFGLLEIAKATKAPFLNAASAATGRAAGVAGRGIVESIPTTGTLTADLIQRFANKRKEAKK